MSMGSSEKFKFITINVKVVWNSSWHKGRKVFCICLSVIDLTSERFRVLTGGFIACGEKVCERAACSRVG